MALCLYLGMYSLGLSQNIKVLDASTNSPLDLVNVYSKEPLQYATTNSKGDVNISNFKPYKTLHISFIGYEELRISAEEISSESNIFKLSPSDFSLEEVVISATRWKQEKREIPQRIVSISSKEVAMQNPQTAADILAVSGEVFVQKSQLGGGSPMVRGFSTNRLLYSVDGVRMNSAIFRSGNLQNVISLDPFAIENTEVLFGPGSVIYGSDAVGAVMSFQTLTPEFSLSNDAIVSGKAVTRYSSANSEKTAHFDVNVGWKKWAILTSFSSNYFGDLRMGANGPEEYRRPFYVQRIDSTDVVIANDDPLVQKPTGYSQINLMQKVRFKPNDKWDLQYAFHYSATSDYGRYDRHIRLRSGLPRSGEWSYGPQIWQMNQFSATYQSESKIFNQMNVRVAHQLFKESRIDRDFNGNTRASRFEQVDAYSVNVDFEKLFDSKSKLFYGVEFVQNDVKSSGTDEDITTNIVAVGPARYPNATWASYAAYLSYERKLSEMFLLQTGARYNRFKIDADFSNNTAFYPLPFEQASLSNGALTGSLGLVFTPTDSWIIAANASTAFRAPNIDDIGKVFDSEPGSVVVPNTQLKPEYAYNTELNITKSISKHLKFTVTGYYTYLDNALVRRNFTLNGADSIVYDGDLSRVTALQNSAYATVYGMQAGIEISLAPGLLLSSHINLQHGEEVLDDGTTDNLRHAAPRFGVTRLSYRNRKLNLQVYSNYSAEFSNDQLPFTEQSKDYLYATDENGNPYSPNWYTLNFKAQYQLDETFTLNAGVENITDKAYRPYSSGIVSPGRNFIISVKASF